MQIYTSITANYLARACVLAQTVRRFHPLARVHLLLAERRPVGPFAGLEMFDSITTPQDLGLPSLSSWVFQHDRVELCTAVKGVAAKQLLQRFGGPLLYLDPDMVLLAPLDEVLAEFAQHPVLLTPHLCEPESDALGIENSEITTLQHGVYNLGFLGLRDAESAGPFLDWWASRLLRYCRDDKTQGLFTDQRWVDLAPCFFPEIGILRHRGLNVATWNLSRRPVSGVAPYELRVGKQPLILYHFSGSNSGALEGQLTRFGGSSPVIWKLLAWYRAECERVGGRTAASCDWTYGFFEDRTPVTREQRLVYRTSGELQQRYPDPWRTFPKEESYLHWWEKHQVRTQRDPACELAAIYSSRAWRLAHGLSRLWQGGLASVGLRKRSQV